MHISSLTEIKKELQILTQDELLTLCLRIAKYKKENKELLHYLLFENRDEENYIRLIKEEMDIQFSTINSHNFYIAKKSIRKILRMVNKHIKYSGISTTTIELLIHYCKHLKGLGIDFNSSLAFSNLYDSQLKKLSKAINVLHEDLQYDYVKAMNEIVKFK